MCQKVAISLDFVATFIFNKKRGLNSDVGRKRKKWKILKSFQFCKVVRVRKTESISKICRLNENKPRDFSDPSRSFQWIPTTFPRRLFFSSRFYKQSNKLTSYFHYTTTITKQHEISKKRSSFFFFLIQLTNVNFVYDHPI